MTENQISLQEELILKKDSIFMGRSILLALFLVCVYMYMFTLFSIFFINFLNPEIYDLGVKITIFIIWLIIILLSWFTCLGIYAGNKFAIGIYTFFVSIICLGLVLVSIINIQIGNFMVLTMQILGFVINLFPCILIWKSKSIKNFFDYQRKIKEDINLKIKLDDEIAKVYIGKTISIALIFLFLYETTSLIAIFSNSFLLNYENSNMWINYVFIIVEIILGLCIYKLYKKEIKIKPIIVIMIVRLILNLIFIIALNRSFQLIFITGIQHILTISFLIMKKKEIDLYVDSEI